MDILIDPMADEPIYQQISAQLRAQILRGALPAGYALPPIRTVSRELSVSVITVKKAWEELESAGLIVTQTGSGCYVADLGPENLAQRRQELARDKLRRDMEYYRSLGFEPEEIAQMARDMPEG